LRGTGNTQYPLRVNSASVWVAVLLAAFWLPRFGGGLATVWASFLIVAPFTCALLWRKFRRTIAEDIAPAAT
jgi:Na+-driven multidrug efflux pump